MTYIPFSTLQIGTLFSALYPLLFCPLQTLTVYQSTSQPHQQQLLWQQYLPSLQDLIEQREKKKKEVRNLGFMPAETNNFMRKNMHFL